MSESEPTLGEILDRARDAALATLAAVAARLAELEAKPSELGMQEQNQEAG